LAPEPSPTCYHRVPLIKICFLRAHHGSGNKHMPRLAGLSLQLVATRLALAIGTSVDAPLGPLAREAYGPAAAAADLMAADPAHSVAACLSKRTWGKDSALLQLGRRHDVSSFAAVRQHDPTENAERAGSIKNRHGICLDRKNRNTNGGKVHMWTCYNGFEPQMWLYHPSTGQIQSKGGFCLDSPQNSVNGGLVHMWECHELNTNQHWDYDVTTGQIKHRHGGHCLDASQRSTNGGKVHMWECNTYNYNQQWQLGEPVSAPSDSQCHTAEKGEQCYTTVDWAMTTGIHHFPEWYADSLTPTSSFEEFQAFLHWTGADDHACSFPCVSCRNVAAGEECYDHIQWAMQTGIHSHPEKYWGLQPSSSFEAFQGVLHFLHSSCPHPCVGSATEPTAAPTPAPTLAPMPAPAPVATQAPMEGSGPQQTCADVWDVSAVDMFDSSSQYSCGARIDWLMSAEGGALSEEEAKAKIALEFTECEPCWPWEKYKAPGDTSLSSKRGIAIENKKLVRESLASLSSAVSWGYGWHYKASTGLSGVKLDVSSWDAAGIHWLPMVWDDSGLVSAEGEVSTLGWGSGRMALLGFNEPNFADQANLSPERAAELWPRVEQLAAQHGIQKIVSPAVAFHDSYQGVDWLGRFLELCVGCKVDAIAFHSYTCYGRFLKEHIDLYRSFGKPLWLTEFACAEGGDLNAGRLSAEGQMEYMREAIPMLEQDPDVEMYAWFSYFEDEWLYSSTPGDAGLVSADGSLSPLGELYASFAPA